MDSQRSARPRPASARPLGPADPPRVGPYALESKLGEGGMGAVYLARRPGGPLVAVKLVRTELAGDPAFLARFRDEVVNAQRVASFCTAQVLDHGEGDGRAYMVTEYIDGPSLLDHVSENGALSPGMLHGVAVGVAAALVAIHAAGLVHRDLKPSNVLLSISGPRVIDFGIARALDVAAGHTATGQVIGSPGWIAPEQILNRPVTRAVDVFAWGCLVAFAGNGRNPFGTGSFQVMAARVLHAEPEVGRLPSSLAGLVRRALDKDPANRPSAQELLLSLVGAGSEAAVSTTLGEAWHDVAAQPPPGEATHPAQQPSPGAQSDSAREAHPVQRADPASRTEPGARSDSAPQADPLQRTGPVRRSDRVPGIDPVPWTDPVAGGRSSPRTDPETPTGPSQPSGRRRRPGGQRRTGVLVAVAAGVVATTAGVAGAVYAMQGSGDHPKTGGGPLAAVVPQREDAATLPRSPMLIRTDFAPGWPDKCHARIAMVSPAAGILTPRPLIAGRGCDILPQWAPDHQVIAFSRRQSETRQELWLVDEDGRNERRLLGAMTDLGRAAWSPDGKEIAYTSKIGNVLQISITDLRGRIRQLTRDAKSKADLSWSRDGKLAFYSGERGDRQVYYLRPDAPETWHRLTTSTMAPNGVDDPHWSPDGRWMAFTVRKPDGNHDLALVDADGGRFRPLTTGSASEHDPTWSPGGQWLGYVRGPYTAPEVWAMPLGDEKKARQIVRGPAGQANWWS